LFIGRTRELYQLNKRHDDGAFEFAVLYGRRRVGKTTLINEFTRGKETIFFTGIEGNAKENLEGLSRSIFAYSDDFSGADSSFSSFQAALETAFKMAQTRRVIFVIDEYPYLAASNRAMSSMLQTLIDQHKDTSKLFLVLCGSSLSFMEEQVLGYQSPLFGRRTCQFKIIPFEFLETRNYFPSINPVDLAVVYGITGGIPLYLSLMDGNASIEDNIKSHFLEPNAYLFEEPGNLIKQECRDPAQYNSIIRAIATGSSKMSEICSKTGIDSALANSYLTKLIALGIVKKETPFGTNQTRKTIYLLTDSMFRFWYRFVPDNMAAIQRGLTDSVYQRIEPQLPAFMGGVFEDICKQYLWEQNRRGDPDAAFIDLGRWWGTDKNAKREVEIDILGSVDAETAFFGECKWTNEKADLPVLNGLIQKSGLFAYTRKRFFLFAKTGFSKGCEERAKEMGNVRLVGLEEMAG